MKRTNFFLCLLGVGLLGVISCKDEAVCEMARLDLAKKWEELRNTAGQYETTKEDEDLSVAKKEERLKVWAAVEEKAELIQTSFVTRQITWPAAEQALKMLPQRLQAVAATQDTRVESYGQLLQGASAQLQRFKQTCR